MLKDILQWTKKIGNIVLGISIIANHYAQKFYCNILILMIIRNNIAFSLQ